MTFNLKQFREQQKAGRASVVDTGTFSPDEDDLLYAVTLPRFHPDTGLRLDNAVVGVYHKDLVARRDALQAELNDLNVFIGEVEALASAGKSIHDVIPAQSAADPAEAAVGHE